MDPVDEELLEGMGNCYSVCGEDFEGTVGMVARARGRTAMDVKDSLTRIARDHNNDGRYRALRSRLPSEFPF